jgi:hypothetical protein
MALIEVFHVVASQYPIDANSATDIPQGRVVTLTTAGEVQLALDAASGAAAWPMGIAGDSRSDGTTSYTPESGSPLNQQEGLTKATDLDGALILGAYGDAQRFTQNRVADNYNEVLASGKMTVYHSGGEFWSDQYEVTGTTFTPGTVVSASTTAANLGMLTDTAIATALADGGASHMVGLTITSPTGYPSGVPGTGPNAVGFSALPEGGNSLSWGNFLHYKLTL